MIRLVILQKDHVDYSTVSGTVEEYFHKSLLIIILASTFRSSIKVIEIKCSTLFQSRQMFVSCLSIPRFQQRNDIWQRANKLSPACCHVCNSPTPVPCLSSLCRETNFYPGIKETGLYIIISVKDGILETLRRLSLRSNRLL